MLSSVEQFSYPFMEPYNLYLNDLINKSRVRFSDFSDIRWMNTGQAVNAQLKRDQLTAAFEDSWYCKNTKPFYRNVSKGCQLCMEGLWSCLFITNKCNANCFYCPSKQVNDETPATQSLTFETAESYAGYINHLGFKGVSFSGGEPLLFFDRTLHYLKTLRRLCSPDLYIWMYTNGILATEEKLRMLADAGLDEVRFDIGATGYRLNKVRLAKNLIPNITIEIPAVPQKKTLLLQLLPQLAEAGVTNLNLHQLRLTLHNAPKLLQNNYIFIPAEQPVVLGSELAALEILHSAMQNHIETGINYCSFYFKNRYQPAGFRKILAKSLDNKEMKVTEKGFIRNYNGDTIEYKACTISEKKPSDPNSILIQLPGKTAWLNVETAMSALRIESRLKKEVEKLISEEPDAIPTDSLLFRIWQMEYIEKGLRDY